MSNEDQGPRNYAIQTPDWDRVSRLDLECHAREAIGVLSARILDLDASPERPKGSAAKAAFQVPVCPHITDLRYQLAYIGYCAEACEELDLVITDFDIFENPETGDEVYVLSICSAAGIVQSEKEDEEAPTH